MPMTRSRRGSPREHRRSCLGFGSMPVESPADMLAVIGAACAQLGERALVCAGSSRLRRRPPFRPRQGGGRDEFRGDLSGLPRGRAPRWRGHHGRGPARRSPQLILWTLPDQRAHRGAAVKRLKVGTARRFSATTEKSLVADLRTDPGAAIPHPGPRGRHADEQTHRKHRGRC